MYNGHTVAAVIVAAGSGTRMNCDKMFINLCGKSVIARSVAAFKECGFFDEIIIAAAQKNIQPFYDELKKYSIDKDVVIVEGGNTRGESVQNALFCVKSEFVMVHDGARALVQREIIENTAAECIKHGAAAAGVPAKDTIKQIYENGSIKNTVPRENCVLIQTPQGFKTEQLLKGYSLYGTMETDDCAVMEKMGTEIYITQGSYENIKLTTAEDLITAKGILKKRSEGEETMRIGTGFDTHKMAVGRLLIIGGVQIPYEKGLLGHSDADVLIHAVIDALFGAAALGDIGTHFPDTSDEYKGISSMLLLKEAAKKLRDAGYEIGNIDATIIAQAPKMAPYIEKMRKNLASAMEIEPSKVSVKAKTNEHMGFTGRGEGIEARAVALISSL